MHRNPVKRGLVLEPDQWRWRSFRAYAYGETEPVKINDCEIMQMKVRLSLPETSPVVHPESKAHFSQKKREMGHSGHGFLRIQVKSIRRYHHSQYLVHASGDTAPYTKEDIDFLVAYVTGENLWYVAPVESFAPRCMLHVNPHGTGNSKFEKYREAWCLMACSEKSAWMERYPRALPLPGADVALRRLAPY
jgi:hypothetical protein